LIVSRSTEFARFVLIGPTDEDFTHKPLVPGSPVASAGDQGGRTSVCTGVALDISERLHVAGKNRE